MEIIIILLPIALLLALAFLIFFIWATKSGQYDDMDTPSLRILFEDNNISKNIREKKRK